ncbi:MAG: sulfur oxidation c-type cytochrome SoxX [Betaproteobacteria bacterium]|nr:sulfur oxidation c-type cytochrome SoxX [Betaproteobacteria bacterium]MDE2124168.1 sulfur oxidation c-type cytochrome SoxX [Betaproteobacteria bacterium]MDE2186375.1 sulfur oxidation c-type cytochrome SoxX [Betaproteobacteria bacterium]
MKKSVLLALTAVAGAVVLSGCAGMDKSASEGANGDPFATASFQKILKNDFVSKGQASVDRLKQTKAQYECSKYDYLGQPLPAAVGKEIEATAQSKIVYPKDGQYLGDWKAGLKIAEDGKGLQWSDKPGTPNGGNCLACHKMIANDPSQGNIGPELYHYAKLRGNSEAILKYTWARIYNSEAFNACSYMPPFGEHKILTEQQMKDVMALLMDPNSPVNQ